MTSKILKGSASIALAQGVSKGLSFLFFILAGRLLGPTDFGEMAFILAIGAILATLSVNGYPQAILWRMGSAGSSKEKGEVLASGARGSFLLALPVIILATLVPSIPGIIVIYIVISVVETLYLNTQYGLIEYKRSTIFLILRNFLRLALILSVWKGPWDLDMDPTLFVMVYLFGPLLALLVIELVYPTGISWFRIRKDDDIYRQLTNYGLPLIASSIAIQIFLQGDIVALKHYQDAGVAGIYYASRQLTLPVLLLPMAASGLIVPSVSGRKLDDAQWNQLVRVVLGLSTLAAMGVALLGPWMLTRFYGDEFEVEATLFTLLGLGGVFLATRSLIEARLLGHGLSYQVLISNLITMTAAVIAYAILVPRYGSNGAAGVLILGGMVGILCTGFFLGKVDLTVDN